MWKAFWRCIMTNTRRQACQGRLQIGCVCITYLIIHSAVSCFLNTFSLTWPRSAAVLLFTSHQVGAVWFLSVQVERWVIKMIHGSSLNSLCATGVWQWRWHQPISMCFSERGDGHRIVHITFRPQWIFLRVAPWTALPIRNIIYHPCEWAVNKLESSEENELTESGSYTLCLAMAIAWALPSASLILVINRDEKKVMPAVKTF